MGNLEISAAQGTQAQPQAKRQAQKPATQPNEPILINFNSLPKSLNNEKVRKFYDKDNSGFIESKNKNGVNEYALMNDLAKSKNIDLKKYNITLKDCYLHDGMSSISYTIGGQVKGPNGTFTYLKDKGKSYQTMFKDNKGETVLKETAHIGILKEEPSLGEVVTNVDSELWQSKNVTKGQNTVKKTTKTKIKSRLGVLPWAENILNAVSEGITVNKNFYKETEAPTYTLNGAKVQAKPIGKGRYEVIDKDGNVSYISHDGVKLKPEYVRKNP